MGHTKSSQGSVDSKASSERGRENNNCFESRSAVYGKVRTNSLEDKSL